MLGMINIKVGIKHMGFIRGELCNIGLDIWIHSDWLISCHIVSVIRQC